MSETPLKIFIGFDERQPVAWQVCAQSVYEHASRPVSITRLDLRVLPMTRRGLTAFTYSRFLVPYLSNFEGQSLFLDSDIVVRGDVHELAKLHGSEDSNVAMVMHEGRQRFERASVMLFNNDKCRELTPDYIHTASLFDYAWAKNPRALHKDWNHLVGYDAPNPDAKIIHYTCGIPVWKETVHCEHAQEWIDTFKRMTSTVSFEALMGKSVHLPAIERMKVTA